MEKPGSSNWHMAEQLFSTRLRGGFGHICANELSPATVITAARMPGMLVLPGWLPRAGSSGLAGLCSAAEAPGGPLAARRQGGAAAAARGPFPVELRMLPRPAER